MEVRAQDARFAAVYNDICRFPYLADVAEELGITKRTVKNKASEFRSKRNAGDTSVPELISRAHVGAANSNIEQPTFTHRELIEPVRIPVGKKTKRFILTSAQDLSLVHINFLRNLEAYAKWLGDCQIMIAGYTYNKSIYDDSDPRAQSKKTSEEAYHESVRPYLTHDQVELGDDIVFCGEMNTLPTATNPLSGFETYTKSKWGIFPHAKIQLQSVATQKNALTKQLMTTGTVTLPNYVQKKSGIKASFHHQIAAVLVEIMPNGAFFCRHLHADDMTSEGGGFYDLDRRIENGKVTTGHRAEALTYGDIHHEKLDETVAKTTWGYDRKTHKVKTAGSLAAYLAPKYQFFHDLSDFAPRNHHNIKDPHFLFKTHTDQIGNVEKALEGCGEFLAATRMEGTQSIVVQSNHDNALVKWLKTADYKEDPENAIFFLETQASYYRQLSEGVDDPPVFEQTLRSFFADELEGIEFVSEDESFLIAGCIECAMHGHLGANGARGNPRQFTRMGYKSNTGHTHSPQILDGAYVGGVSGSLDMGYNRGLSSWAHAHILTYANGQRTILTMNMGHWFAPLKKN